MKICIIASGYPNEDGVGGTFVEQLVNQFVRQGHSCIVISPLNTFYDPKVALMYKEYEEKTVDNHIVKVYRPRIKVWNIPLVPVSTTRYASQRAIERTIEKHKWTFDCIYCHFFAQGILAWHYAHKHHIPLFVATGESRIPEKYQSPCLTFSWKKFRRDVNGVVCVSTKNYEECIGLGYADKDKCKVFPNGVNLSEYGRLDKAECRKELGYKDNDFILSIVGEISDRKGQKRVIEAIDRLKKEDIKFLVIGKGDELPQRDYLINLGKVPHNKIPLYLNASDVFIMPTLREGCCNAIVEAMACGLPIISSDRKFNYDILDENSSIMVDPEDIDAISKGVEKLYQEKELRAQMADEAYKSALGLNISTRAANIISFMQNRMHTDER